MKNGWGKRILCGCILLLVCMTACMPVLSAQETLPVLAIGFMEDEEVAYTCTAFCVQDNAGNTCLVTIGETKELIEDGCWPMLLGVDYFENAEYLGSRNGLAYYTAEGLERIVPLKIAQQMSAKGSVCIPDVGEESIEGVAKSDYVPLGEPAWSYDHGIYYLPDSDLDDDYIGIGGPIVNEQDEVVGYLTWFDGCMAYVGMAGTLLEDSYAYSKATSQTAPKQEESTPAAQEQPVQEQPAQEQPVEKQPEAGEPASAPETPVQSATKKSVPWGLILIIAAVCGAGVFVAGKAKKKNENTGTNSFPVKEGTIALDVMESHSDPIVQTSEPIIQTSEPIIEMSEPVDFPTVPLDYVDPAPAVQWQVRGVGGTMNGNVFLLRDRLRFGRDPQNEVAFANNARGISAMHCELTYENGRVQLRDLQSSYGTYLAGNVRMEPRVAYDLNLGDEFTLADGGQTFRLERAGMQEYRELTPSVRSVPGGQEYHADMNGCVTFGRGPQNKVVFDDADSSISSMHCRLFRENGKLFLMDMGSTNGTFFSERERLKPNVPYRVHKGQSFYLVASRYTFVITEE